MLKKLKEENWRNMRRKMQHYSGILLLAALMVSACGGGYYPSDVTFIHAIEDLPLPPHFVVDGDLTTSFETDEGRIVDVYARTRGVYTDVVAFYRETLPQLGWKALDDHHYRRENEQLMLDITPEEVPEFKRESTRQVIHFMLRPVD